MVRPAANTNAHQRDLRLDPCQLPVRYSAPLRAPGVGVAAVLLDRERVVIRRPLGGVEATLACPVAAFRGVAVRMTVDPATEALRTEIELMHPDSAMSLPLASCEDLGSADDVAADWQAWGKALGLPLLIVDADGSVREVAGARTAQEPPRARRMPALLKHRRPRNLKRRRMIAMSMVSVTEPGSEAGRIEGREIIARD